MQYNNTIYHVHFIINIAVCAFSMHEFFTKLKLKCSFSVTTVISKILQLAVGWFQDGF